MGEGHFALAVLMLRYSSLLFSKHAFRDLKNFVVRVAHSRDLAVQCLLLGSIQSKLNSNVSDLLIFSLIISCENDRCLTLYSVLSRVRGCAVVRSTCCREPA